MKKYFVLFIIFFSFASCREKVIKPGFTVTVPEGWIASHKLNKRGDNEMKMHAPLLSDTVSFVENVGIFLNKYADARKFMEEVNYGVKGKSFFFEDQGLGETMIDGHKFFWEKHLIALNRDDKVVEQKTFYFSDGQNIYMIVGSCNRHGMNQLEKDMEGILATFHITGK